MEVVVTVAVAALVLVFIACALAIVFIIRKKVCLKQDLLSEHHAQNNPDVNLIDEESAGNGAITLDDVLQDDLWIDDMSGVFGHALLILRGCHSLTSKLVSITVKECQSEAEHQCIAEMARRVSPRLEDVVHMLDGPVDPRLVEARCTALVLSVSNLVLVVKSVCRSIDVTQWVEEHTVEIEKHLQDLRAMTNQRRNTSSSHDSGIRSVSGGSEVPSSRASSSNTDSGESGIDIHTPIEQHNVEVHQVSTVEHSSNNSAGDGESSSIELQTVTLHSQSQSKN